MPENIEETAPKLMRLLIILALEMRKGRVGRNELIVPDDVGLCK
jgi:hypothetical protein